MKEQLINLLKEWGCTPRLYDLNRMSDDIISLINKPVETTNEQLKLNEIELNWLKYELEARNQEFGYEPNDILIRDAIFKKIS